MVAARFHILLLEPYYGGSHKAFLNGLCQHVDCCFTLLTLPARKWKMRMQLAAPWFAEQVARLVQDGLCCDGILCSTFLDVAVLRSLLGARGIRLPLAVYFHENQFSYPGQVADPGIFQFTCMNFTSALCADRLAFNSHYNLESFLTGVRDFLKKSTDMQLGHLEEDLRGKAQVLYPGIDFSLIDAAEQENSAISEGPVIVWNHRWEHDKDPETFFNTLFELQELPFRVIVLGQHFRRQPEIFARAREVLGSRILHFGYAEERSTYARLLKGGDIVVSTALHEFFGMAVLEAVRAGCRPVVPDRLSYCELFPNQYRYGEGGLKKYLARQLRAFQPLPPEEAHRLTRRFRWPRLGQPYGEWLHAMAG